MQSPFPGMDPYTEARDLWQGIHTQLIGELGTHQLPPLLAPAYFVDVEPSLQVRSERTVYPDIEVMAARHRPDVRPAGIGLPVAEATAYEARNFRHRLDYRSDPEPPLTDAQRALVCPGP